jgi:5'-nucleotidase
MDFPLISSNITYKENGSDFLKDHITIKKNGITYGIFGLSTPETAFKTNPNNITAIQFNDPVAAAAKEVQELKSEGADVIVALSHLGTDASSEVTSKLVAEKVEGIDLIVDGHSHSVYDEGLAVGDTLIVSTGEYLQNIGVVLIDPSGKMQADLVNATEFAGTDPAVDETVTEYTTDQEALLSQIIGYSCVNLDGVREHVRSMETNLGDFATDAFRFATGADVAITNGGGIRASIPIGDITKKDIITVFPFGNYVVTKKVTGEALLLALENGVSTYPEPLGAFLQVSGIKFTIDPSKPAGSRVTDVKVKGQALDPKAEYLLATNDFIVAGGDGYTMLADFAVVNEYGAMEDVLIDYLMETGDVTIQTKNRIKVLDAEQEEAAAEDTMQEDGSDQEPVVQDEQKDTAQDEPSSTVYIVVKGDYLKKIAEEFLGEESDWKLIYQWNKDVIKDPDKIYIGQELVIYEQ